MIRGCNMTASQLKMQEVAGGQEEEIMCGKRSPHFCMHTNDAVLGRRGASAGQEADL
jgi:hypothetical protein